MDEQEVTQFPDQKISAGNGSGGTFDDRLRDVENRLTKIETQLGYGATKSDIDKLKKWVLIGALSGVPGILGSIVQWVLRITPSG